MFFLVLFIFSLSSLSFANDTRDLDDIKLYNIVKVEQCLDQAYDTIPGNARKLEFKIEGDDPIYEFDIESTSDGSTYNVECNAEEGIIVEVEKEVKADNKIFSNAAKITIDQARKSVLDIHPGKVVNEEREIGFDGSFTYEFDIETDVGYEIKVDVDAVSGKIEEASFELYEIGIEKE
ncbi:PepSY domain-containing protein [Rickettsiales bacterium]|nr:PepSY domain-containing protein [Rickettsiales bacterium]